MIPLALPSDLHGLSPGPWRIVVAGRGPDGALVQYAFEMDVEAPSSSAPPVESGSAAFAASGPNGVQIFSSNGGTTPQELTSDRTVKGPVAWSPDGTLIAFTSYDVSTWTERLEVMSFDGSKRRIICEGCTSTFSVQKQQECGIDSCSGPGAAAIPNRLAWSPDGSVIAAVPARGTKLTLVHPDGSDAGSVSMPGLIDGVSWSADGSRIAVTVQTGEPGLYVVNVGSGQPPVALLHADPYYAPPAWSPNGGSIAFPRLVKVNDNNMAELDFVDPSTGESRKVLGADSLFEIYDLEWSPDGSRLAVLHHPVDPPTAALLTVNAQGDDVQMVALCENGTDADGLCTQNGGEVSWLGNDTLAFENFDGSRRGFLALDIDTGDRSWLTTSTEELGCCLAGQPRASSAGAT